MFQEDMPLAELLELQDLLDILNEEELTKEQDARLQEIVTKYASARQYYLKTMFFFGQLRWQAARQEKNETPQTPPAPSSIIGILGDAWRRGFDFLTRDTPFALFLILIFSGISLIGVYLFLNSLDRPSASPGFVAQITATKNCQWSAALTPPVEMMHMQAGQQLQLEKGIAQITYSNGAVVLLKGSFFYTVDSPKSGFLTRGKLTVRADTEQSRQFTIATPGARFIDLGTEFGVTIDDKGRSIVAVFAGKVNAEAKLANGRWDTPVALSAGEAVVCVERKFSSYVAQRSDFPTLRPLPSPPLDPSFQRWLEAGQELQKRPDLLAYYDFQPDPNNNKVLLNRAPSGAALNGDIQNATWTQGRFSEKKALQFMAEDAGVRVNLPGKFQQMTFITWVNINQLANNLNGLLLSNDWSKSGQVHWEIYSDAHINMSILNKDVAKESFYSKDPIPADCFIRWCMISALIDTVNKRYSLYIDDKCILSQTFGARIPDIEIGAATIAGWLERGSDPSQEKIRNLMCRMDEFMIFQTALTADEIKRIYEAGKP
jgi:hypothetical protein